MRKILTLLVSLTFMASPSISDTLSTVKARGEMIFGLEAQYKPFEFRDENNEIIGYDIDVATEIGNRLGNVAPAPVDTNWSTVIQSLNNGDFDLILGGMTATAERFKRVNFSYPYMDASSGLLVTSASGISSPSDMNGKSVAAGAGTPQINQLELAAGEHSISYNGDIKTFDDDTIAVAAMKAGRIDAYASTLVSLLALAQSVDGVTVIPFTSEKWSQEFTAMAFRKNDETFRNAINEIIVAMKEDGTLGKLQEKWFGQSFVDILPNKAPEW